MFGCDLPVCSADYSCIQELVTPDVNGRLFRTADELAGHFLVSFPTEEESPLSPLAVITSREHYVVHNGSINGLRVCM
jgi:hypothetical protein